MKKMFGLILALVMCLTLCVPAFAATSFSANKYSIASEFDGIMQSRDGEYAVCVPNSASADQFLALGRLDIPLNNKLRTGNILNTSGLEPATKEYIEELQIRVMQNGNADASITVFSANLLDSPRNSSEYYFTTPSGRVMKGDYVFGTGLESHCDHLSGSTTSRIASGVYSIGIIAAGFARLPIAITAAGISLLDVFSSNTGTTVVGGAQDWSYLDVQYDCATQFTYDRNASGAWVPLLTTQYVTVRKLTAKQHYLVTGNIYRSDTSVTYPNAVRESPHYQYPWDKALQSAPYGDSELVTFEFAGRIYYF